MTSKLQVTVPKALAVAHGIKPGDEIEWASAGETIRILPVGRERGVLGPTDRLRLFDLGTARQRRRQRGRRVRKATERGWIREDLYERGRAG